MPFQKQKQKQFNFKLPLNSLFFFVAVYNQHSKIILNALEKNCLKGF